VFTNYNYRIKAVDFSGNSSGYTTGSSNIQVSQVVEFDIANNAVTAPKIVDNAVTNSKIQDNAVTTTKIADASITTAKIQDAAITNAKIANAAIDNAKIADASITDAKIVSLTASKLTAGTIDASQINVTNLNANNITVGTINGQRIADGAISATKLADNAVTSMKIATVPEGYNLIINSDFSDSNGNASTDGWVLQFGVAGSVVIATNPKTGNYAYQNAANSVCWVNSQKPIPIQADRTYIAEGYFKTVSGSGGVAFLAVRLLDSNLSNISGDGFWWYYPAADIVPPSEFTYYSGLFGAGTSKPFPPNARYMQIGFILNYVNFGVGDRIQQVQGLRIREVIESAYIKDAAITNAKIASLDAGKITTGTLDASQINVTNLNANNITVGTINGQRIADGAISTTKIADNAVTNAKISSLDAGKITTGTLDASLINVTNLNANNITVGTINGQRIADGAISATKLADNAVTSMKIATVPEGYNLIINSDFSDSNGNASTDGWVLQFGVAGSVVIATNPKTGNYAYQNAANSVCWVNSQKPIPIQADRTYIAEGYFKTVSGSGGVAFLAVRLLDSNLSNISGDGFWWYYPAADIVPPSEFTYYSGLFGAGTSKPFPPNARYMQIGFILNYVNFGVGDRIQQVQGLRIREVIESAYIKDAAITNAKIASLDAGKITTGTLDASQINVTNLNANNITVGTINGQRIADGAISTTKIADNAVTNAKISSLDAGKITTGYLNANRIAAGSITADKINATSLSAISANLGTVTSGHLKSTNLGNSTAVLTQPCDAGATTIYVDDTSNFPSSGTILMFNSSQHTSISVTYTSKTATSFTGCSGISYPFVINDIVVPAIGNCLFYFNNASSLYYVVDGELKISLGKSYTDDPVILGVKGGNGLAADALALYMEAENRSYPTCRIVAKADASRSTGYTALDCYAFGNNAVAGYFFSAQGYALKLASNRAAIKLEGISEPSTGSAGEIYYDSTLNRLRYHNGTTWVNL